MDKNDLISRSAAMDIVKRTSGDYAAAWAEIKHLPAVDPVHAADACYCQECKLYNKPRLGYCSIHMDREDPDDFCGYGVKKGEINYGK